MSKMQELRLKISETASNPARRLPLLICVDASFSMKRNNRINLVNQGIHNMLKELSTDIYAVDSVEVCIVKFGGASASIVSEFHHVTKIKFEDIKAEGQTPLGQAVNFALAQLQERLEILGSLGIEHYKPWLVIFSDGEATDHYQDAAKKTREMEKNNELKVIGFGLGEMKNSIAEFSYTKEVYNVEEFSIEKCFAWLSQSMSKQSQSTSSSDVEKEAFLV